MVYWAHLDGFGAGFLTATLLLYSGLIQMRSTEQSLYDVLGDQPDFASPRRRQL